MYAYECVGKRERERARERERDMHTQPHDKDRNEIETRRTALGRRKERENGHAERNNSRLFVPSNDNLTEESHS